MKQDRVIFLDYLRGIACFLVMMVHASEAFYGVGDVPILSDAHKFWIAIWDGMSRISVPLSLLSGEILPQRKLSRTVTLRNISSEVGLIKYIFDVASFEEDLTNRV